jgi:hypothetical protein
MSKQKIFLYTSDIAAYIGQNKYDFVTPFERLWKRCDSVCYNNIIKSSKNEVKEKQSKIVELEKQNEILKHDLELKLITKQKYNKELTKIKKEKDEIVEKIDELENKIDCIDLNQKDKLIKLLGEENIKNLESNSLETENKKEEVAKILNNMEISEDKKSFIKRETESFINKTHGTLKEDTAIEMYEKKFNVKLDTSQQFNKINLKITDKNEWYICGKVDGLYIGENKENSYIVEVKNRTKGFFSTLRDYEKTQIQLYMYMLDLKTAKLVEKYKDKIRITVIYRDIEYINDIIEYINIFVSNFENNFLSNLDAKINFVNQDLDNKKIILKKLYLNEINNVINKKILDNIEKEDDDQNCMIDDLD